MVFVVENRIYSIEQYKDLNLDVDARGGIDFSSICSDESLLKTSLIPESSVGYLNRGFASNSLLDVSLSAAKEYSIKMKEDILSYTNNCASLYQEYDDEILNLINRLKKKWDDFADLLSQISFFKNEFQKMLSMKYMFEYIVDSSVLFKKYWKFIMEVSKLFFENFDYKLKIKKNDSFEEEYEKEYKKFSRAFMKKEKFFYTKIYNRSDYYDESMLEEVTNLLVR